MLDLARRGLASRDILTPAALHNAMAVHAAFGGSTNLLLHIPAIAFEAGLERPTVDDWNALNVRVPRLVSVLPNGPDYHPTVRAFLAGGVPEVMLHLRELGLLDLDVLTASGWPLGDVLDAWQSSGRRARLRDRLFQEDGVDPDEVIMTPARARERGLTSTVTFPRGNLAPEGSVIKSTAIDLSGSSDARRRLPKDRAMPRVFTREPRGAIAAIKGQGPEPDPIRRHPRADRPGGRWGAGMEEIYQITSPLKAPVVRQGHVAVVTDARFSGVSTGRLPRPRRPRPALAGGPIGRLRDGDLVRIVVDRNRLEGTMDLVGTGGREYGAEWELRRPQAERPPHPGLLARPRPPERHPALGRAPGRGRRDVGRVRLRYRGDYRGSVDGPRAEDGLRDDHSDES